MIPTIIISDREITEVEHHFIDRKPKTEIQEFGFELKSHADENDLVAIIGSGGKLIAINCRRTNLEKLLADTASAFWAYYKVTTRALPPEAAELASKLTEICSRGFVQTLRAGDTGVGYTLETLLGIAANSSKSPDYKGIEIKSGRSRSVARGRTTIISLVPNWGSVG